jgi:DNA-binding LacI/PurR family transcriptional regulator
MSRIEHKREVTMTDVAARCGVSYQTVSRVINEMPEVADATRTRVLRVIEQLGYRPNMTARHLVSRRSTVLGHVSFAIGLYGPSQTMVNVEESAKQAGYRVMFTGVVDPNINEISRAVNELCSHRVAGVLVYLPLEIDLSVLRSLCQNIPIVAMDSDLNFKTPAVMVQQKSGSRIATEHLINLGHRRIACIRASQAWRPGRLRYQGWLTAMKEASLIPGPCIEGDWSPLSGFQAAQTLIKDHWGDFTALVVANDQMALGAIRAFHEAGISVPDDISVVGFDDIPESGYFLPPLTTIRQDFPQVGKLGVQCLLEEIRSSSRGARTYTIVPTLIQRASTARPRKKSQRPARTKNGDLNHR